MNSLPGKKVTRSSFASAGGGFVAVAKVSATHAAPIGRDRPAANNGGSRR